MRRLSDELLPVAEMRALNECGRADLMEVEDDELGIAFAVRCPSPKEYEAYVPHSIGPMRSSARYNLVRSCLAYPCDDKGEPDYEALNAALDTLPALTEELHQAIDSLATADPHEVFDLTPATMPRAERVMAKSLTPLQGAYGKLKIVDLPEGAPVRGIALKTPSRATWDDYSDGSGLDRLCEKAEAMYHDCVVGVDDKQRCALLRWAPALAIALASELGKMAGNRRDNPRKKARRASSARSALTSNTPGNA